MRSWIKYNNNNAGDGFTFVEIVAVMAIALITATIALVAVRSYGPAAAITGAARALATDLRAASALAVATQINHAVRFDIAASRYTTVRRADPEVTVKEAHLALPLMISAVTFANSMVEFNTIGAPLETGTITIAHRSGRSITVEVRASGYVRIE